MLAMLDYISRINGVPMCDEYNDLRKQSLKDVLYPTSIVAASTVADDDLVKQRARDEAIPEFIRFNIVESEVRDVV